jgi:putative mRNA 3-end processing factor
LDFLPSNLGVAHAAASGWMALASRRAAYDAAFVVSDHVDWRGILDTIADTGAERVITTHGYADVVARYLQEQGLDAASQQDASQDATSQQDASQDASQDAAQDASQDATSQQDASHDAAAQH